MNTKNTGPFQQEYPRYHERGLQIVPILQKEKRPCVKAWSNWSEQKQPLTYLEELAEKHPLAGIGLVCGPSSNITALDIDLDLSDPVQFALYERLEGVIPPSPVRKVGNKGITLFYRNSGEKSQTFQSGAMHVADLLSIGRQTVLPPSIHPEGMRYRWDDDTSILDVDAKNLPCLGSDAIEKIRIVLLEHHEKSNNTASSTAGRNNALKAQVTAAYYGSKSIEVTATEILYFDTKNHVPPLFSDMSEAQMKGRSPKENALRFTASIYQTFGFRSGSGESAQTNNMDQTPSIDMCIFGLAGSIIEKIAPHTEAGLMPLLVQLLVFTAQVVGRSPHWIVGGTRHYLNQFILLLGRTSSGRKGTSTGVIREIFRGIDADFCQNRIVRGLSSGEGLINLLRDSPEALSAALPDKRLLIIEEEFVNVLKVSRREGNTLSGILRSLWDSQTLQLIVRNDPLIATDPFGSIVAHITASELRESKIKNDVSNGVLNRFLFIESKYSQLLPLGGALPDELMSDIRICLRGIVDFGKGVGQMDFTKSGANYWETIYKESFSNDEGDISDLTARNIPILRRLACTLALFDSRGVVDVSHIVAAKTITDYSAATCLRFLEGGEPESREALGKRKLLSALALSSEGLTRDQMLKDVFKKNWHACEITSFLTGLIQEGLIEENITTVPPRWRLKLPTHKTETTYDVTTGSSNPDKADPFHNGSGAKQ
jgi:Bifunctional DNA primase/polymerase, N-terminal